MTDEMPRNRPDRRESGTEPTDEAVQEAWANWDPAQGPMPDILSQGGRVNARTTSGWDEADIPPMAPFWQGPWVPASTPDTSATPSSTAANWDSDEGYGDVPYDDLFAEELEDRDYLEFILYLRGCANRRRANHLRPIACNRVYPCHHCRRHQGCFGASSFWKTMSDTVLEQHVRNYLRVLDTLPPWQPSRPDHLKPRDLVFGPSVSSEGAGFVLSSDEQPAARPQTPDERTDAVEHVGSTWCVFP
ncbi:hypothetical protein AURDEDRAFT_125332 [Auricularia subglabra TFB-10046 SS5]|nr:hypothetical protein AURDEDRAFT_125332 [Auricularia subglabra TFB-10046 SS5]